MNAQELYNRFTHNQDSTAILDALIARLHDDAFRLARALLGDDAAAEDALQNAYLGLVKGASRFDTRRPFRPWWYTILLNAIRKEQGRSRPARPHQERTAPEQHPARRLEDQLAHRRLRQELQRLPDRLQRPLVLHFFEGRSHAETAAALGLPKSTASSRIQKGLEELRARLKKSGYAALATGLEGQLNKLAKLTLTPSRPPTGASLLSLSKTASIAQAKGALLGLITGIACLTCVALSPRSENPQAQSPQQKTRAPNPSSPTTVVAAKTARAPAASPPPGRAAPATASDPTEALPLAIASGDLLITVRDPDGKPRAKAQLAIVTRSIYGHTELSNDDAVFSFTGAALTARTDSAGQYRWLPQRNPTQRVCIIARAGDLQTASPWLDSASLATELELTLRSPDTPAPGRANLIVRLSINGAPLLGKLSGYLTRAEANGLILEDRRIYRETNALGDITIQDLNPGRHTVEFDHPTRNETFKGSITLAADEVALLTLDSKGDFIEVQGRISLPPEHSSSAKISLETRRPDGNSIVFNTLSLNGRYRLFLPRLQAGTYTLQAKAEACCRQRKAIAISESSKVEGPDFELRCGPGRVRGRIITPDGRPIPEAGVELRRPNTPSRGFTRTDARGRFAIAGLSAGKHRLSIHAQIEAGTAWHDIDRRTVELPSGDTDLGDITANQLQELGSASVEVRDSRGDTIAGAAVQGTLLDDEVRQAQTDPRGIAELLYLPAGKWLIAARSPAGISKPEVVTITDGQRAFIHLVIEDQPESKLSGLLLFEGRPAPGLEIELSERLPEELRPAIKSKYGHDQGQPPLGLVRSRSDRLGRFRFPALRAGTYDLASGSYKKTIQLDKGAQRLTVELAQKTGEARLRVVGLAHPRGVAWIEALLPKPHLRPLPRQRLANGEAVFDKLLPITHGFGFQIALESGQQLAFTTTKTIQEGAETRYDLDLSPANSGSVILHTNASDAPRTIELHLRSNNKPYAMSSIHGIRGGAVRFDHLPAGTYAIFIWADGARSSGSSEEVTIIPGQTVEFRSTR